MPTYEYECTQCESVTEVFQPITEKPRRKLRKSDEATCDCNVTVVRRIGTGGGIIFKGSGFYQTDYRSDSYKKAADADKPSTDSSDKSSKDDKKKTESKADAKADTKPAKKEAEKGSDKK